MTIRDALLESMRRSILDRQDSPGILWVRCEKGDFAMHLVLSDTAAGIIDQMLALGRLIALGTIRLIPPQYLDIQIKLEEIGDVEFPFTYWRQWEWPRAIT